MSQDLPVTSYALLGLLTFGDELTGYELKQRADRTLGFYWVAPAMSQVYSELSRLHRLGLVDASDDRTDGRSTRRYQISAEGRKRLQAWLADQPLEFPVLKHPVALRLLLGHLADPEQTRALLDEHREALTRRIADLQAVRESLRGRDEAGQPFRYPAMVADWGLEYFASEHTIIEKLLTRLEEEG